MSLNGSSIFNTPSVRYFTFQGDYTLECLRSNGSFTSYIDNDTYREDLFRNILNSEGLVYFTAYG